MMALNNEVAGLAMAFLVVAESFRAAHTMVATQVRRVYCMAFFVAYVLLDDQRTNQGEIVPVEWYSVISRPPIFS